MAHSGSSSNPNKNAGALLYTWCPQRMFSPFRALHPFVQTTLYGLAERREVEYPLKNWEHPIFLQLTIEEIVCFQCSRLIDCLPTLVPKEIDKKKRPKRFHATKRCSLAYIDAGIQAW